jgi:hypothetical protein
MAVVGGMFLAEHAEIAEMEKEQMMMERVVNLDSRRFSRSGAMAREHSR